MTDKKVSDPIEALSFDQKTIAADCGKSFAKNKFESKTKSRSNYDIIVVKKNGKDEKYALCPWFGFGSYGVWQKIDPTNGSWSQPPQYLKMISPGEGFYFITSKNYPTHTFSTP